MGWTRAAVGLGRGTGREGRERRLGVVVGCRAPRQIGGVIKDGMAWHGMETERMSIVQWVRRHCLLSALHVEVQGRECRLALREQGQWQEPYPLLGFLIHPPSATLATAACCGAPAILEHEFGAALPPDLRSIKAPFCLASAAVHVLFPAAESCMRKAV